MAVEIPLRSSAPGSAKRDRDVVLGRRLGIDYPAGCWPAAPRLKSYEAAGFDLLQVALPAGCVLADARLRRAHAQALRESLRLTGLGLILDAGAALIGPGCEQVLDYAACAGAELVVCNTGAAAIEHAGARREVARALRHAGRFAAEHGLRIAVENLAPAYPGAAGAGRDPAAVAAVVRAVGCEEVGICLDLGHAHIVAGSAARSLREVIEPVLDQVILFHAHDNFGARSEAPRAGGIEPFRLDLHLAPGAGSVPWAELAPLVSGHGAPIQLEIHPAKRPEPATLAIVICELLGLGAAVRSADRYPLAD